MEAFGSPMELGKRKRGGVIVRCGGSSPAAEYDKSFCLCFGTYHDIFHPKEWYMLNVSSTKDDAKAGKEKKGKQLRQFLTPELREAYVVFHHNERHRGRKKPLPMLPLITQLKKKEPEYQGTCSAVVESFIFRFGGERSRCNKPWSRKVNFFDASCPEKGWRRGPRTLCGRVKAATVALHGKLYVFGGCHPDGPRCFAEFLDTRTLVVEDGKTEGEWNPLSNPPSALGFKELFAAVLDCSQYSGKILVASKSTGAILFYDVDDDTWTSSGDLVKFNINSHFVSPPLVVDSTVYWINLIHQRLYAFDFVKKTEVSMLIGDFEICKRMDEARVASTDMNPTLLHLDGNIFCVIWMDNDDCLHCTKLQVSMTGALVASVLCCHSYHFDHKVCLLRCLPMNPSLFVANEGPFCELDKS